MGPIPRGATCFFCFVLLQKKRWRDDEKVLRIFCWIHFFVVRTKKTDVCFCNHEYVLPLLGTIFMGKFQRPNGIIAELLRRRLLPGPKWSNEKNTGCPSLFRVIVWGLQ